MAGLLKRCATSCTSTGGTVWIALGVAFLALGFSGTSTAYIGMGVAFLAIALALVARKRGRTSPE